VGIPHQRWRRNQSSSGMKASEQNAFVRKRTERVTRKLQGRNSVAIGESGDNGLMYKQLPRPVGRVHNMAVRAETGGSDQTNAPEQDHNMSWFFVYVMVSEINVGSPRYAVWPSSERQIQPTFVNVIASLSETCRG
jgi:hypothetical protein